MANQGFIDALADALRTTDKVARQAWDAIVLSGMATTQEGSSEAYKTNFFRVIPKLRSIHFHNRQSSWNLLQEIIRIDNDPDHPYHDQASAQVKKLLERYVGRSSFCRSCCCFGVGGFPWFNF